MIHPRILLVEDEALSAMLMESLLQDLGCVVAGSFAVLSEAIAFVEHATERVDGALLDVNLGGEMVFPLAAALQARGAPFAFVTGYASLEFEPAFAGAPVLTKPIEHRRLAAVVKGFAA